MKQAILLMCLSLMVYSGCASVSVNADYDTGADFSALRTYAWVPGEQPHTGDPRVDSSLLDSRIRNAVDQTLAMRGYQLTSGEPDFYIKWMGAIEEKLDVTTIDTPYAVPYGRGFYGGAWGSYYGSQTMVNQYEQGTVIFDIIDARENRLIWRGTASATVNNNKSPEKRVARIQEGVTKTFAKFPPGYEA